MHRAVSPYCIGEFTRFKFLRYFERLLRNIFCFDFWIKTNIIARDFWKNSQLSQLSKKIGENEYWRDWRIHTAHTAVGTTIRLVALGGWPQR